MTFLNILGDVMENLLLTNINLNSMLRKMSENYLFETSNGYNGWIPYLLNEADNSIHKYSNIFIILDGMELLSELNDSLIISSVFGKIRKLAQSNKGIKFWISDIHMQDNEINELDYLKKERFKISYLTMLEELIINLNNVSMFPLSKLIVSMGTKTFYSPKLWYLASMKYTTQGETAIIDKINFILMKQTYRNKKCLFLDMDNTLWGNVISEVGYNNIELSDFGSGARYKDFQKRIKEIKDKGIILVIVSKNNYEDAISAFKNNNMFLKQQDFVHICANWNDKADNIINLAKMLNLGLDSIVFVDDNPVERERVKQTLPEVIVPEFPKDTSMLNEFAIELYDTYFWNPHPLKDDMIKTKMYQDNMERNILKYEAKNIDEYIKSLNIVLKIKKLSMNDVFRISELSNKTNQYNTTSIRYTEQDLIDRMNNDQYRIYIAEVSDRVGDNGLCLAGVFKIVNQTAYVENLFMSCRVMGRYIETAFLSYIIKKLKEEEINKLNGLYIPNGRNVPAEEFFIKHNFQSINKTVGKNEYVLNLKDYNKIDENLVEVKEVDS